MGKMVFTILGEVAELVPTWLRFTSWVKHARAKKGGKWGRMRAAVYAEQIRALLDAGKSMAAITIG